MSVPEDVQELLRERVETFEQLESLLLLWKQRDRRWSLDDIATGTKMRGNAVATALDELRATGLVDECVHEGVSYYHLSETSPAVEATLERLRRAYEEDTLEVMKLMSRNSIERLRTAAIRTFADAFVLGKKKDG